MNKLVFRFTHSKWFLHVFYILVIAALLTIQLGPKPVAVIPTATAAPTEVPAPTEAPATAVPTAEPTQLPMATAEPSCDWTGHWDYVGTHWPSITFGFSSASIEMAPKPLCATVVKVDVPGRGAFNFFYFRAASGNWFVSPPIEAIWGTDSLVYPIGAVSDGKIAWYTFYNLRENELIEVATDSEAVGLITHTMTVKEAASLFPEQPCGLPVEVELVEQVLPVLENAAVEWWVEWWIGWTTHGEGCDAYSTLFVTSSEDTTRQYTWLSDGATIWGPIEREGNTIPNILRWRNNAVTMFDLIGNVWTVEIADDGSFDVVNDTQYNQVIFEAALPAELDSEIERSIGPGYLEPLATVFPLDSPVNAINLEGWITLPSDVEYLIAYYRVGNNWKEVIFFATGNVVTNGIKFDADYMHFDWLVEVTGDQTIVTSCTAGLTKETGTVNTFTIVGDTVTLAQKPGTCR